MAGAEPSDQTTVSTDSEGACEAARQSAKNLISGNKDKVPTPCSPFLLHIM